MSYDQDPQVTSREIKLSAEIARLQAENAEVDVAPWIALARATELFLRWFEGQREDVDGLALWKAVRNTFAHPAVQQKLTEARDSGSHNVVDHNDV